MRKLILLSILLPALLFGQYGHRSNVLVTADTTDVSKDVGIFMFDTSGDTLLYMGMLNYWKQIYGRNDDATFDSLYIISGSLFKGDATFQADILMTGTVSETLEVIGTAATILMVDNDDASPDSLSITMDDSLAKFDGSTFVIDTHNGNISTSGKVIVGDSLRVEKTSLLKGAVTANTKLIVSDSLRVEETSLLKGTVTTTADIAVGTKAVVNDSLRVEETALIKGALTADTKVVINDSLRVEETSLIKGAATFNDKVVVLDSIRNEGTSLLKGAVTANTKLVVNDSVRVEETLLVKGITTLGDDIHADGNYIKNAKLEYSLAQGVSWNQGASSSVLTRLGSLTGIAVSTSAGDSALPVQNSMKRCLLNDDGTVNYYLDPDNSYMKQYTSIPYSDSVNYVGGDTIVVTGATFTTTADTGMWVHNVDSTQYAQILSIVSDDTLVLSDSIFVVGDSLNQYNAILNGDDGQVVVEMSKFYVKHTLIGSVHSWYISKYHLSGFSVHPAFLKDGVEVNHKYIGAYEACIWDNSAGVYLGGETDIVDTAADKLASVVGMRPHTNETRAEYRSIAENRGQGWHQWDSWAHAALQLLYIIEYADFNSQTAIGTGNTSYNAWSYSNNIGYCGYSNPDGNGTNASNTATSGLGITDPNDGITNREYMSYRGIENFYGSVWQWIDGINVDTNREVYLCYMYSNYADDTSTDYEDIGTLATSNGYINNILNYSFGFFPSEYSGGQNTYLCDYFWQAIGAWRVVRVGGRAHNGVAAGVFCFDAANASSDSDAHVGARLCF